MFEQEEELKFLFCLHGFHHVKKLQGDWFFLMSEKQCGVTSEDRILDHLIDVSDIKMPLHHGDQGLDDLHVLVGVSDTILKRPQGWWKCRLLREGLVFFPCFVSTQSP